MYKNIKCYILSLIFLSISFIYLNGINADIVSIDSYGDGLVMTPEQNIEGFYFGEIPITTIQETGGFISVTNRLTKDFICPIYERGFNLTDVFKALSDNNFKIDETQIKNFVDENCKLKPKNYWWIILLIFVIFILISYYNRKRVVVILSIFTKKNFQKRFINPIDE